VADSIEEIDATIEGFDDPNDYRDRIYDTLL